MNRVFKVELHLKNGSAVPYNVIAKDDVEAREKAENELKGEWDAVDGKYTGVDFAEIILVCNVDVK